MTMTFNPGPSQISDEVLRDVEEVARSGLLSESHRGEWVKGVLRDAVDGLRDAMRVPDEYAIVFQPSATAAMECVLRNCVERSSFHFVRGAFAERFAATAERVGVDATRATGPWNGVPGWRGMDVPDGVELIAVTHNETSTGAMWPADALAGVRAAWPGPLLAVDVTSSFGALVMDWTGADVWFGSVQKCLGLPAGLGFLLVGPRALEAARDRGGVAAWQDLNVMADKMETGQTVETPNVLAIALLARQAARWDLDAVERATREKAALVAESGLPTFVDDPAWRSLTVHNLVVDDPDACVARAVDAGFVIGRGYGKLRPTCIRIATFPAHGVDDVRAVLAAVSPASSCSA